MLKVKYSYTFNQDQFLTQDYNIIQNWFNLYQFIKMEYKIFNKDIYNID